MKDLISLHAALPDRIGDGLINVRKMMMIGGMFQVRSFNLILIKSIIVNTHFSIGAYPLANV